MVKSVSVRKPGVNKQSMLAVRRDCVACDGNGSVPGTNIWGDVDPLAPDEICEACRGVGGGLWVADGSRAAAEDYVARKVADMMRWNAAWPAIAGSCFESLTPHQCDGLTTATSGAIGILEGPPGAGKTYTLARLIDAIIQAYGSGQVAVCSPTGKAAVRCGELLFQNGVREVEPKTIHRTLGVESVEGGSWTFAHNERNPLREKFIVVDEFSMVNVGLFASLLRAVARGSNLLLVGDVNQLLPIEHGAPLRDLMPILPRGELTQIHRNAGTIVRACHQIREGVEFDTDMELDCNPADQSQPPRNLKFVHAGKSNAAQKILDIVKAFRDGEGPDIGWDEAKAGRPFDPITDVQVLVAVNSRSPVSREAMNSALQELLNPHGQQVAGCRFRVGDKVLCLKNGFFNIDRDGSIGIGGYVGGYGGGLDIDITDDGKAFVANGEFGRVVRFSSNGKQVVIEFQSPKRRVIVPVFSAGVKSSDSSGAGGDDESAGDIDLGYAVTVWKAQGSSMPVVIVAIDEYAGASGPHGNCSREFVYTAISRAERLCYMVGRLTTAHELCRRQFIAKRKTFLRELTERYIRDHDAGEIAATAMQADAAVTDFAESV